MIEKRPILIGLTILMISVSVHAAYSITAVCHVNGQQRAFLCENNRFWKTPLWDPVEIDQDDVVLSTECVKDTGGVFNSNRTLQEECGGNPIQYQDWPSKSDLVARLAPAAD